MLIHLDKRFLNAFCVLQVAAVPEDVGTAGALRAIAHHLTANDILVSFLLPKTVSEFGEVTSLQLLCFFIDAGCKWRYCF